MRRLLYYYLYLFFVWGCFRYFVRLPNAIEELWFKPMIWVTPLFWWSLSLRGKNGFRMFGREWLKSLLLGLVVGLIYFCVIRRFDFSIIVITPSLVGVVLATSITEELTFSGFVTGYLEMINKRKWMNLSLVGVMAALLRLPILIFAYKVGVVEILGVLGFVFVSSMVNAWIRSNTNNVFGSIVARVGMGLSILG